MLRRLLRFVGFAVMAFLAVPAGARTLDVIQQSSDVFRTSDGSGGSVTGRTNFWHEGRQRSSIIHAGGFQLRQREAGTNDAYEDFMAFCVDMTTSLHTSVNRTTAYEEAPDLFSPVRQALVATLFQEVYDPTGSVVHQGAFQIAVWKLTHGDVSDASADGFDVRDSSTMTNGVLSFTQTGRDYKKRSRSNDYFSDEVLNTAQGWLDQLDGRGPDWELRGLASDYVTFLHGEGTQDLVTAARFGVPSAPPPAAIPLPGALWMSGAGIAALALVSRRRQKSREG